MPRLPGCVLAASAVLAWAACGAVATASPHSCVPTDDFQTVLSVGRTHFFTPQNLTTELFVCQHGGLTYRLGGSIFNDYADDPYLVQTEPAVGRFVVTAICVNFDLRSGYGCVDTIIDTADLSEVSLGGGNGITGATPVLSTTGYVALLAYYESKRGFDNTVLAPGPTESAPTETLDPGPVITQLAVHGSTASWMADGQPRQAVLPNRPAYMPLSAGVVSPEHLRRIAARVEYGKTGDNA